MPLEGELKHRLERALSVVDDHGTRGTRLLEDARRLCARIRRLIAGDFAAAFGKCDLIAGPAAPSVAYDLGAKKDDPVQMYLDDLYTIPINLAGLPGMSIPCGFGAKGRPVGLQIVGNYWDEARMLAAAHAFQQATDWHTKVPPGFE